MADNKVSMPSGFGGLTRYDAEYDSLINLKPTHVIAIIIFFIIIRVVIGMYLK
jgi:preprotein translocase subunit Sec61beta